MPRYIVLMNWTEQGVKGFAESVDRADAARVALAGKGLDIKEIYWTVGSYDIVAIADAADDETASAAMLGLAATGRLRTTTMRAFSGEEFRGIIQRAG
jgi:uncharacterized protein with GYD domain